MNQPGYFEIQAADVERAVGFYRQVFGWRFTRWDEAPIEYWRIETDGMRGGVLARPAPTSAEMTGTNAFTVSMQIEGFDGMAERILDLGGQVAMPKFAVPGICWQGYFMDSEGNVFGIFEVDENAA
jgi:predicted enzyme related to lactoylglutathione lyase